MTNWTTPMPSVAMVALKEPASSSGRSGTMKPLIPAARASTASCKGRPRCAHCKLQGTPRGPLRARDATRAVLFAGLFVFFYYQ